ncbi:MULTISPECIES: hypothetical protein [unclassified Caballeronia]|uniref:hypothetical protein n=1 Tax=unclassified Caballeronia TaxID=2646786 RepID=UPI002028CEDC|nr:MULTISPECIES: hypothetical protein [unclassified Caballeronia]
MSQQPLFPVRVRTLIPNATGSVDLRYFAVGEDGQEYAVKEALPSNSELPASEYLGYCLSAVCKVAVPTTAVLELPDGSLALGSRFEGGVSGFAAMMPADQLDALKQCSSELSALLTLDVFIANDDRHANNFLQRRTAITRQYSMVAIDFSRGMFCGGFPIRPPVDIVAQGNTAQTINFMKAMKLWDNVRSHETVNYVNAVTVATYDQWVSAMPPAWVTAKVAGSVAWWGTSERSHRLQATLGCV